jgi:hypothetical protein
LFVGCLGHTQGVARRATGHVYSPGCAATMLYVDMSSSICVVRTPLSQPVTRISCSVSKALQVGARNSARPVPTCSSIVHENSNQGTPPASASFSCSYGFITLLLVLEPCTALFGLRARTHACRFRSFVRCKTGLVDLGLDRQTDRQRIDLPCCTHQARQRDYKYLFNNLRQQQQLPLLTTPY